MSPKKPVYFLNYLCQNVIVDYLVQVVSQEDFHQYAELSTYFENATVDVIEEILTSVMTYEDVRSRVKCRCFKVLFKDGVRHLDCSVISQRYHQEILEDVKDHGGKLRYLDLRRFDHTKVEEFLENLNDLRVLLVPYLADDSVVQLASNMKHLSTLNISYVHPSVLHGEVLRNFKSDSLTCLDIGMKGKLDICFDMDSLEVLGDMLKNLINLKHVKTYSFTGHAVLRLNNRYPKYRTKLLSIKDSGTNLDVLQAIASACPQLEDIDLTKPFISDVKILKKLKNVKVSHPNELLANSITSSKLSGVNLTCSGGFRGTSDEFCVNLTSLKCREVQLTFKPIFKAVQVVELFSCEVTKSFVKALLTNAPKIRRFVLTDEVYLRDVDIEDICTKSQLAELEEFWLSKAECLTACSARLLIRHCRNLKVIGQLGRWAVDMSEVNLLRWETHLKNTMVNIFNYSFFKI